MNRQLLRQQNNLVISGMGVIMLGIWTVVRMVLYSLLHMEEFTALMPETVPRILFIAITYVVIAVILAVILLVRFYIGRSAMAEGRGERRNSFYLVLAGILAVMNLGHGRAGHLPDYSYIRYKYLPAWADYRIKRRQGTDPCLQKKCIGR